MAGCFPVVAAIFCEVNECFVVLEEVLRLEKRKCNE